jgi:phospholipid/cholesterol/gamma-HCH transport system substrate-binding protein
VTGERRQHLLAGGFVVAMAALLLVWLSLLSGRTGATDGYFVVYDRVLGLRAGTEITFDGYPVGRIESIEPVDEGGRRRYRVDLRLRRGWPVPEDSRARVLQGLFSRVVVDIAGGRSPARIPPGGEIPGEVGGELFSEAGSLVARLSTLLEELRPLVEQTAQAAPRIVANLDSFTAELDRSAEQLGRLLAPGNVDRVSRALASFEQASGSVSELGQGLAGTRERLDALLARVSALVAEDRGEVSGALRDLEHSLAAVARHIDAIAGDLETSSRNLSEFTRQLREDPAVIVRGRERAEPGAQP